MGVFVIEKEKLLSFPSSSTLARYFPVSQVINFNTLSKKHLEQLLIQLKSRKFKIEDIKSASLVVHETQHYFDHMATLSGQILLKKIYDALNELNENTKESTKELLETLNTWKHGDFDTSVIEGIVEPVAKDWKFNWEVSTVLDGDKEKELLFATFFWQDEEVGKVPFSIEALWETNAMWAEISYHVAVNFLQPEEDRLVENYAIDEKYRNYFYNSELLVYSFAAHLVSSYLREYGDLFTPFRLSKAFASISLNLPYKYYSQIKRPLGMIFKGFTQQSLDKAKSIDPCIIFLTLLENTFEAKLVQDIKLDEEPLNLIDLILEINGLPNSSILNNEILLEMNRINIKSPARPFSNEYKKQKKKGIKLFEKLWGIQAGINVLPAIFFEIAAKADNCVFQEDMEETEVYKRYSKFKAFEEQMINEYKNS